MSSPVYFCTVLGLFTLVAGLCALWIVDYYQKSLIDEQKLAFPIGQVMHSMIAVQKEVKKAYELLVGVVGTAIFCALQDGIGFIKGFIPKSLLLFSPVTIQGFVLPALRFDLWPMLWAIGFITGHVIAIPLAVGALANIGLVNPVHSYFFSNLSSVEFTLAFCSGMVVVGAFFGFVGLPSLIKKTFFALKSQTLKGNFKIQRWQTVIEGAFALAMAVIFLTYFKFSFSSTFCLNKYFCLDVPDGCCCG